MTSKLMTISIPLLIIFFSFISENDYVITNTRAGLFKIGDDENQIDKLISNYDVETYLDGIAPRVYKYKVISNNSNELIHLKFIKGKLNAMKVYDKRYMTKSGLGVGSSVQNVYDIGMSISYIQYQEKEGLRCYLNQLDSLGSLKSIKGLEFYFERKVDFIGDRRDISKNAKLKFFSIGEYFDIEMDTLSLDQKRELNERKKGYIINNRYVNNYFNEELTVPESWIITEKFSSIDYNYTLVEIKNSVNDSRFLLDIRERDISPNGKYIISSVSASWGQRMGASSLVDMQLDDKLYRSISISNNLAYYATVKDGHGVVIRGNWVSEEDLKTIETIFLSLYKN
ncbi:hypothetical protein [Fulvivirga ligni]|uniref:hypothetical protein n=1 Tax=Fulvivirga ligni TaxID=2904246 RepID=UPI001F3DF421|nr:hypothetical protein [Fulvivirga ligni]UII19614.1 hypothetical protein LVD16_17380 [Fulvivirga ligni]